ncbi:MAG: alpha/beta fold hydrolase [Pseudomonadota bacterium]
MPQKSDAQDSIVSRMIEVDGVTLHLRSCGEGDAPPLVLLHGLGGDSTAWTLNQRPLAENRPVIALDLPGHGKSERSIGDGAVPTTGALLAHLPDALDIDRFHLAGLSYGGAVAMDAAGRISDHLLSLTCVSATGLGRDVDTGFIKGYLAAESLEVMRPLMESVFHDTRIVNDAMVGYALLGRANPEFRRCIHRIIDANFEDGAQKFRYRDTLATLPCPVHVIWGREDTIVPVEHATFQDGDIDVHVFDGVGHMPNVEAAERFNRLLAGLLAAADPQL